MSGEHAILLALPPLWGLESFMGNANGKNSPHGGHRPEAFRRMLRQRTENTRIGVSFCLEGRFFQAGKFK